MSKQMTIADITHPKYELRYKDWNKWRLTYHGGQLFINQYLRRFGKRETHSDFEIRKSMTYCPSFAEAAVDEVKNSIYQRLVDISRDGGSTAYQRAVTGLDNGVDMLGSTMSSFIGQKVLPELLSMGCVGVYVDMPPLEGSTLLDLGSKRPYIYLYEVEDIRSWTFDESNGPNEYGSLLLRDYVYKYDPKTNLPIGQMTRYRHYQLRPDPETGKATVWVQFYDDGGQATDVDGTKDDDSEINLGIDRIPFVLLEMSDSLLANIANYQIALLNIESADIAYVLKCNFPFYTEQYNSKAGSPHLRPAGSDNPGSAETASSAKPDEVELGVSQGRRYPQDLDRPGFIHPSPEPLQASMEKGDKIKADIRLLLNLSISNMAARSSSAEARGFDERSLESGLSAIGLELEAGERKIASFWSMYEGKEAASVKYPEKYDLQSDEQRRKSASEYIAMIPEIASKTYQVEMALNAVRILLGNRVSESKLQTIAREIAAAPAVYSNPDTLKNAVEAGYLDLANAAKIACYPADAPAKAAEEHATRLARIQMAQTPNNGSINGSRGVLDAGTGSDAKQEKAQSRDTTTSDTTAKPVRGDGK